MTIHHTTTTLSISAIETKPFTTIYQNFHRKQISFKIMTAEFSNKPYKSPSLKKTTCYRLLTGLNISPRCPSHSNNMLKRKINVKFPPRVLNFEWVDINKKKEHFLNKRVHRTNIVTMYRHGIIEYTLMRTNLCRIFLLFVYIRVAVGDPLINRGGLDPINRFNPTSF